MKKVLLIVNPAAGRGRTIKALPGVEKALRDLEVPFEVVSTKAPDDATRIARKAAENGFETVACLGGDGTVSETGKGLVGTNTTLALLPCGTGNDFARALGFHRNLKLALRSLREGSVRVIDVGRIGPHFFLNTVGIGFDGVVAHGNQKIKKLTGMLSYLVVVIKHLPTYRNPSFSLKARDWEFSGKGVLVEVGNGITCGGGFYLTPEADLSDGLLNVTLVGDYGPMRRFYALPMLFLRRVRAMRDCHFFRTDLMKIAVDRPTFIHVDGNIQRLTEPTTVEILPAALKVLFPPVA